MRCPRAAAVACALLAAGCAAGRTGPTADAAPGLVGTTWQLVEFRSNDDAIGTVRPEDPTRYTLTLAARGEASLRLDCNRGFGTWTATPSDGDGGELRFGPLGMTKVYCGPSSMDHRIARDAGYVRTYLLRDDRLHLDLMADGGTYVWEPAEPAR